MILIYAYCCILKQMIDCDQASVMRLIDVLLQIDLLLVEARMDKIWPILIQASHTNLQ